MNMTKQNRAELKALIRSRNKVVADHQRFSKSKDREFEAARKTLRKLSVDLDRQTAKANESVAKTIARIDKRIAIVEGRLA